MTNNRETCTETDPDSGLPCVRKAGHEPFQHEDHEGKWRESDELYRIAKERAEGKRPNVPWRRDETDEQRRERWNAANPQDPI